MADTATLTLRHPLDRDGGKVKTVEIRRPLVEDHLIASRGTDSVSQRDVNLVRICAGLTEKEVRKMDLGDMLRAQDVVTNFLTGEPAPKT